MQPIWGASMMHNFDKGKEKSCAENTILVIEIAIMDLTHNFVIEKEN